jgi:hypothetical protein
MLQKILIPSAVDDGLFLLAAGHFFFCYDGLMICVHYNYNWAFFPFLSFLVAEGYDGIQNLFCSVHILDWEDLAIGDGGGGSLDCMCVYIAKCPYGGHTDRSQVFHSGHDVELVGEALCIKSSHWSPSISN